MRSDNTWLWTRLTDEHLDVCLKDFAWMAKFGDESARRRSALTRDQISKERARRRRHQFVNRRTQWPVSQYLS